MVEELIHGNTEFVEISSDYEYVLGQVMGALLDFKADFEGKQWEKSGVLDSIALRLETRAKQLAEAQRIYDTGNLIDNIKAYPEGGRVHLTSGARKHSVLSGGKKRAYYNPRSTTSTIQEGYYGGHVEFGHKTPDGGFYPARPYLRPALRLVAEESRGEMIGTIQSMFSNSMAAFDQRGFSLGGRTLMYTGLSFGKNFSYKTSPSYQHGLSKLTGFDKRYQRFSPSREQKSFSKAFGIQRGSRGSGAKSKSFGMKWSGNKVRAGEHQRTMNKERINPNKGQRVLNAIKSGRNPSYHQTVEIRSMSSPHAIKYYSNQAYKARQAAKEANKPSVGKSRQAEQMKKRGLLRGIK